MPGEIYSRDIDVLVYPEDIVKWMDLLTSICNSLGLELKKGQRYLYCHACFIEGLSGYPGGLEIDLEPALNWRGVDFLDVEDVLSDSIRYKRNIWIPHPADECVITFCSSYLHGGHIKPVYVPLMSSQAKEFKTRVQNNFALIFGKKYAVTISESLINENFSEILNDATKYRIRALFTGAQRSGLIFLYKFILSYWFDWMNKIWNRKGLPAVTKLAEAN